MNKPKDYNKILADFFFLRCQNNSTIKDLLYSYTGTRKSDQPIPSVQEHFVSFLRDMADELDQFAVKQKATSLSNEDKLIESLVDMTEVFCDRDKNEFPLLAKEQTQEVVSDAMNLIDEIQGTCTDETPLSKLEGFYNAL